MPRKNYEIIHGSGLNKYYMVGGYIAANKTMANKLLKRNSSIGKVVDGIINTKPIDRKKSVSFIKSLAK